MQALDELYNMTPRELIEKLANKNAKPVALKRTSWKKYLGTTPTKAEVEEGSVEILPLAERGLYRRPRNGVMVGEDAEGRVWLYRKVEREGLRIRVRSCLACPMYESCLAAFTLSNLYILDDAKIIAYGAANRVAYLARMVTGEAQLSEIPVRSAEGFRWLRGDDKLLRKAAVLASKGAAKEAKEALLKYSRDVKKAPRAREALRGTPEWEEFRAEAYGELRLLLSTGVVWELRIKPVQWPGGEELEEEVYAAAEVYDWGRFIQRTSEISRMNLRWSLEEEKRSNYVPFVLVAHYELAAGLPEAVAKRF